MKREPYGVEQIKQVLSMPPAPTERELRLILSWAHERALSRLYKAELFELENEKKFTAFLNEVLDEIGFPHE